MAGRPRDADLPQRAFRLATLQAVLDGSIYDGLPFDFHTEKDEAGNYVPLRQRRPSVRYGLCAAVVNDSTALLFSEGHFPQLLCDDADTLVALGRLLRECQVNRVMMEAARLGSVGSACLRLRVLKNRLFVDALATTCLTPEWDPDAPDTLRRVTECYKVTGRQLRASSYVIADDDLGTDFWFRREWTATHEWWFVPRKVSASGNYWERDRERSVAHRLGVVPLIWIRNLPGGDEVDGACTFAAAIDTSMEIDYLLSQGARGLKYSADPTLLIKEPALGDNGPLVRGAGNAITVGVNGDAKLLEINGGAAAAIVDYVRCLRELALESVSGNRASAERLGAAQSGRAMELLHQSLIWLADKLRISYGEGALLDLLALMVRASGIYALEYRHGEPVGRLNAEAELALRWPQWFAPTPADLQQKAGSLKTLVEAGVMSPTSAVAQVAMDYGLDNAAAEWQRMTDEEEVR